MKKRADESAYIADVEVIHKKEIFCKTNEGNAFLELLKTNRAILLARLQSLGLLSSFLEAENRTKPKP